MDGGLVEVEEEEALQRSLVVAWCQWEAVDFLRFFFSLSVGAVAAVVLEAVAVVIGLFFRRCAGFYAWACR